LRITTLGEYMFSLTAKPSDPAKLDWIRGVLVDAGLILPDQQ
jgi:hypothetical protein